MKVMLPAKQLKIRQYLHQYQQQLGRLFFYYCFVNSIRPTDLFQTVIDTLLIIVEP